MNSWYNIKQTRLFRTLNLYFITFWLFLFSVFFLNLKKFQ